MIAEFLSKLNIDIQTNTPLAPYTTFQLGGPVPCIITCETPDQIEQVVKYLQEQKMSFILLGGGSNVVVSDQGIDQAVVRYISKVPILEQRGSELEVSASACLDDVALYAAEHGLDGLNCTTGIPGTVGGAIVGNAGAFGKQISDCLKSVTVLSKTGDKKVLQPESLEFSYRDSILKRNGAIVLSVVFSLSAASKNDLIKERDDILKLRAEKHPDINQIPSAGSFFRNIEPTSKAERRQAAGWFLEQAEVKDFRCNGASVFEKHANIIVKSGECTAQDVYNLSQRMAQAVKEKFGIDLVREVRFIGKLETGESAADVIW